MLKVATGILRISGLPQVFGEPFHARVRNLVRGSRARRLQRPARMGQLPLRCPDCGAHGWVTLVTDIFSGTPFHWRCTNCHHEWGAAHSTEDVAAEELLVDRMARHRPHPLFTSIS